MSAAGDELVQELTADVSLYFARGSESNGPYRRSNLTESSQTIYPLKINITRSFDGLTSEECSVSVLMSDPSVLAEIGSAATARKAVVRVSINDVKIYEGRVIKATQNEDNVVKMMLANAASPLAKANVTYDTNVGQVPCDDALQRLLFGQGPFSSSDVVINVRNPSPEKVTVSGEQSDNLRAKVEEVATNHNLYTFVDRDNKIVVTNKQPSRVWKPSQIIEIDAGDEESVANRVIVETAESGPASRLANQWQGDSTVTGEAADQTAGAGSANEQRVTDHSLPDQSVADQRALAEIIADAQSATSGTVTIPGDPRIGIYDGLIVPEISDVYSLSAGRYTIKRVTQKFTEQNGYVSKIDLCPDLKSVYTAVTDGSGIADRIKTDIYNAGVKEIAPSDINSLAGRDPLSSDKASSDGSGGGQAAEEDTVQRPNCTYIQDNPRVGATAGEYYREDIAFQGIYQNEFEKWQQCEITTDTYNERTGESIEAVADVSDAEPIREVEAETQDDDMTFGLTDAEAEGKCTYTDEQGDTYLRTSFSYSGPEPDLFELWQDCSITTEEYNNRVSDGLLDGIIDPGTLSDHILFEGPDQ